MPAAPQLPAGLSQGAADTGAGQELRLPDPAAPATPAGLQVWTSVDKLLTHDVCGPGTFGIFQKEFGDDAEVGGAQPSSGAGCQAACEWQAARQQAC